MNGSHTTRWLVRGGIGVVVLLVALAAAAWWLWRPASEGEALRLAAHLGLPPGATIGEIGAGRGTMAIAPARHVGTEGRVYASDLSAARLADIVFPRR